MTHNLPERAELLADIDHLSGCGALNKQTNDEYGSSLIRDYTALETMNGLRFRHQSAGDKALEFSQQVAEMA